MESEGPQGIFREGRRLGPAPLRGPAAPLGKRTLKKNLPLKLETPGASQGYKKAVNTDQAENKRSPPPPATGELGAGRKRCVGHAGVELALWPETGVCPLGSGPQQHRTGRFPETQLIGRFNTAVTVIYRGCKLERGLLARPGIWHFWGVPAPRSGTNGNCYPTTPPSGAECPPQHLSGPGKYTPQPVLRAGQGTQIPCLGRPLWLFSVPQKHQAPSHHGVFA